MRLVFWIALATSFNLVGQQPIATLKKTLFEAEAKYNVTFTFNDALINGYISLEKSLPDTLGEFQLLLEDSYGLVWEKAEAALLLSNKHTFQPSVCGYIKSDWDEDRIENVLVRFGNRFAYSDPSGFFSFQNANPNTSEITFSSSAIGRKTLPIAISDACPDYFVNASNIDLDEVILNYIAPPIQKGQSGSFSFALNRFQMSPGSIHPDVFELLRLIPGVTTPNEDNQLFIRGGTPDQNQVLWNSIRLYQNNHANGGLSSLNPYSIQDVKLFVKGVPSSYGDHTSGLILLNNYTTDSPTPISGSVGLGLLDSDVVANFNFNNKLQLNVSARASFNTLLSDNFVTNTFNTFDGIKTVNKNYSEQTIYYNDFNFSSSIPLKNNASLAFHAFYMEDQLGYHLTQENLDYNDALSTKSSGWGTRLKVNGAQWKNEIHFSLNDFKLGYDRQILEFETPDAGEEIEGPIEADFEDLTLRQNRIQEVSVKTEHQTTLKKKIQLRLGTDVVHRNVFFSNKNTINETTQSRQEGLSGFTFAAFGSAKTTLFKKTALEGGLRFNYFETLDALRLEPRLTLTRRINSIWSISSSYEKKSQTIYQTNETIQNSTARSNNIWTFAGNERFPLIQSEQLSLGFTLKRNTTLFDVDVYARKLAGITTFNFGYLDPNDTDFHLGKAAVLGSDFFFQKTWEHINLWANYSFQDSQNKFEGIKSGVWYNSNFLVKHVFTTGVNYRQKNWTVNANYTLRSGIPVSKPSGFVLVGQNALLTYDTLNTSFLPQYERLDLSLSKSIPLKGRLKLDFKVALKNVTHKRNVLERIYFYDSSEQRIKNLDRYSLFPFLNFGVRFFY